MRPVREQPREGTGGQAGAWAANHSPTGMHGAHNSALPPLQGQPATVPGPHTCFALQGLGSTAAPFSPMSLAFPEAHGSVVHLSSQQHPTPPSRLQGPPIPGFLLPARLLILLLSPTHCPTPTHWSAPDFRFLHFGSHGPFGSL